MNNIIWYVKRKYLYSCLMDEIYDLCYKIKHVYPTELRCKYEAFMFWRGMHRKIDEYAYGYGFHEFEQLRKYEKITYQCIKH